MYVQFIHMSFFFNVIDFLVVVIKILIKLYEFLLKSLVTFLTHNGKKLNL